MPCNNRSLCTSYVADGKKYRAKLATPETLDRLTQGGHVTNAAGRCVCGAADFYDPLTRKRVRCLRAASGKCMWFETNHSW